MEEEIDIGNLNESRNYFLKENKIKRGPTNTILPND